MINKMIWAVRPDSEHPDENSGYPAAGSKKNKDEAGNEQFRYEKNNTDKKPY